MANHHCSTNRSVICTPEFGRRRYLLGGGPNQIAEQYLAADLHTDGGGTFAAQLGDLRNQRPIPDESSPFLISDEDIVQGLIAGLLTLGQHARDRAGAGGNVLVQATLVPTARPIEIGHNRMMGFGDSRSSCLWSDEPVPAVETSAVLDELAAPSVGLLQTARMLADQLGQVFGIAEMNQIRADGSIQIKHWRNGESTAINAWAKANSLPTASTT